MGKLNKVFLIIVLVLGLGLAMLAPRYVTDTSAGFGAWSLIPPILAILLAFLTRQVILSLFLGVFSGVLMVYGGDIFTSFLRTLDTYLLGSLADSWNAAIIFFTLSIGGMAGIVAKSGGTKAVAEWLAKKAKTPRAAQISTIFAGIFIFFDDYANTLIVGPTMRPMTDKMKISREKLAYIVDSTAAPIVGLAAISTWVGYEIGIISGVFGDLGVDTNFFLLFMKTVPFTFYNIFAIALVIYLAALKKDYGPMYKAEKRARLEGKLLADDAKPMSNLETQSEEVNAGVTPKISSALIPIITLIVTAFVGLWYNGYTYVVEDGVSWTNMAECFGAADPSVALIWAAIFASIVAGVTAMVNKTMKLGEVFDSWIEGCKSLFITAVILVLAWSIGTIVSEIGTADFLVGYVQTSIPAILLPIIVFIISCLVAFATGTSWGTMAIVVPLAVPLAANYVNGSPEASILVLATLSSVLSGSIFGDHCSPISDTTIMSSMASGADHMDHVKTQIPYALTGAAFAIIGYLITGLVSSWIGVVLALLFGILGIGLFVKYVGKSVDFGRPTHLNKNTNIEA
ncbi:Na+/H+ antiporter NhaC family protein [Vallitalea okinawensis]|uniref:Na+/H+ antiporter NhaC family protein n=1 Tax=Vallitalea okinawensis TaxID=2078660 RepID=UPI000CFD99F1|nr:Na+/H+ antiporter NhaC family protein [Vallitalea okinawensis]